MIFRFKANSRKVKFLVSSIPTDDDFPVKFTDFQVEHYYLHSAQKGYQTRLRKRAKNGRPTYTFTVRKPEIQGQTIEVKQPCSQRDFLNLLTHKDDSHLPVYKTRRSFFYQNQQYQLDLYSSPCHPRCNGLILLETFTTLDNSEIIASLPPFIGVVRNVTGDPAFSMYNLSIRFDWEESVEQFCYRLSTDEDCNDEEVYDVKKAQERLLSLSCSDDSVF